MFFIIRELLNQKKLKKENAKKIDKNNNSNKNKTTKNKNKKNKKILVNKKVENPLATFLKENKERGKSFLQKNKDNKKKQRKENKKNKKTLRNKKAYPFYYQLILHILILTVIFNIFINTFSKGYEITGVMKYEDGKYLFEPTLNELCLNDYEQFRGLKKGDTIYIYYDKKHEKFKYSLNKKWFTANLEGTINKATNYYLYIDFDFKNEIHSSSYHLEKHKTGEEFTVVIKKFLFKYTIEEPLMDSIIDKITNLLKNVDLKNLKEDIGE